MVKKSLCSVLIILACCLSAAAGENISVTAGYELRTEDTVLGRASIKRTDLAGDRRAVTADLDIQSSGWWGKFSHRIHSQVLLDQGGLLKLDHKIRENDHSLWISGERQSHSLWCLAREIQSSEEKEDDGAVGLAVSVAAGQIPYAGLALNTLSLLGGKDEKPGDLRIPLDLFDTTSIELPAHLFGIEGEPAHREIRVLNTFELEIRPVGVEFLGTHSLKVCGRRFSCRKFSLRSKDFQSVLWVARDELGPFIVKEEGTDTDGPYEMSLKTYGGISPDPSPLPGLKPEFP